MTESFEPPTPDAPAGQDQPTEAGPATFPSWTAPTPPVPTPAVGAAPDPTRSWSAGAAPDPTPSWAAPANRVGGAPPAAGGPWGDPRPWTDPTQPSWPVAGSPGSGWSAPGGSSGGGTADGGTTGGGYGAGGWPPGGWAPRSDPQWGGGNWGTPPRKNRLGSVAAITAAMVAAALVGVGIGRAVNTNRTIDATSTQQPVFPGFSPGSGSGSGSGSSGSGSGSGSSGSSGAAVANVEAGVVDINTSLGYQSASAAGTGMIVTSSGEVLTNNHVIDGATKITATLVTTGKSYTAHVVGTDVTADVALLQLDGASGLKTVPLGDSSTVSTGASVIAIGNAGGVGGAPSVVDGTVQATGQTITASDQGGANAERLSNLIETNAPIRPGDSGGPLVDANGKVIGMDTAASSGNRFQAAADVAFAIPINDALSVVHQIEAGHESSTIHLGLPGFLGVEVQDNSGLIGSGSSGAQVSGVGVSPGTFLQSGADGAQTQFSFSVAANASTSMMTSHSGDFVRYSSRVVRCQSPRGCPASRQKSYK